MSSALRWTPGESREIGPARRLLETLAVIWLWIGIGELLTGVGAEPPGGAQYVALVDTYVYLLIGIPLVASFQLFVRRRPLIELWMRDGRPIGKRVAFRALAAGIAIYPLYSVIKTIADPPSGEVAALGFYGASLCGAAAAAYCYLNFDRQTWRYLGLCLLAAVVTNVIPNLVGDISQLVHPTPGRPSVDAWWGVQSFLLYIATGMVMEEVAFRGCFDSHIHHQGDRYGIPTAILLSMMWGAWHLPLVGWDAFANAIIFMGLFGTFLSIFWRKSGNLGVTGTAHAFADAIRNATGGTP